MTRPEPANGTGSRAKKADTKKRARAAAGSTALLALFCFFVFMGPVPFWPGSNSIPASRSSVSFFFPTPLWLFLLTLHQRLFVIWE